MADVPSPKDHSRFTTVLKGPGILYLLFGLIVTFAVAVRLSRVPVDSPDKPAEAGGGSLSPDPVESAVPLADVEARVDPNTASWNELAGLPGIGEVLAKRIVEFRQSKADNGSPAFKRPEDLEAIRGIGPKTAAKLAPHLRFPEPPNGPAGAQSTTGPAVR